jgi:hypothetical protein
MATKPAFSNERLGEVGHRILVALSADDRVEGTEETSIETDLSLEALLFVAAGIIEADTRLATPRDLREAGEGAGERLRAYVRNMRQIYESEGVHGLEAIGAGLHMSQRAN